MSAAGGCKHARERIVIVHTSRLAPVLPGRITTARRHIGDISHFLLPPLSHPRLPGVRSAPSEARPGPNRFVS